MVSVGSAATSSVGSSAGGIFVSSIVIKLVNENVSLVITNRTIAGK